MRTQKFWTKLSKNPKTLKIAAFDVEGSGAENDFVCASIIDETGCRTFIDKQAFSSALLSERYANYVIFSHNMEYDILASMFPLPPNLDIFSTEYRWISAKYTLKSGKIIRFWDTTNILPSMTVKTLGNIIGLQKFDTPNELLRPGGLPANQIHDDTTLMNKVIQYNLRDTEIIYNTVLNLQNYLNELGGELKPTAASIALDLFRRKYLTKRISIVPDWINSKLLNFYAGGRVENFRLGHFDNVNIYDVNSMYPSVMRDAKLPDPNYLAYTETGNKRYIENLEGVSFVDISSPNTYLPLLHIHANGNMLFPLGRWQYAYTHAELRKALTLGYKIHKVLWSVFSLKDISPYTDYVDDIYDIKINTKDSNPALYLLSKMLLNSLYGKSGQRNNRNAYSIHATQQLPNQDLTGAIIDIANDYFIIKTPNVHETDFPFFANILWPMYVTALARLKLFDFMLPIQNSVIYCDTDSIHTTQTLQTSDKLGELKLQYQCDWAEYRGPKYYRFKTSDGNLHYRIRSVPQALAEQFWNNFSISFYKPLRLREALQRKQIPAIWVELTKSQKDFKIKRKPLSANTPNNHNQIDTTPLWIHEVVDLFGHIGKTETF